MNPTPTVSPVVIPSKLSDPELADLETQLLAAAAAHKTAQAWVAEAADQVAQSGAAFSESVRGDYPDGRAATAATSKAEKALAAARRDVALLQNVVSFRLSAAEAAASAVKAKRDALLSNYVIAASQQWRDDRDAVHAWFKEAVIASLAATPEPFRSLDAPAVGADIYVAYDLALRALAAARDQIAAASGDPLALADLVALEPRAILGKALAEGRFTVAA